MKVLIADDHQLAREGLKVFLRTLAEPVDIVEGATLYDALEHVGRARCSGAMDLIVLDLLMPGMDGLVGLRKLRQVCPDVPIIIISALDDAQMIETAFELGVRGYIPKGMTGAKLVKALAKVIDGEIYRPEYAEDGEDRSSDLAGATARIQSLTRRECDVLELLIDGLSNKEIARRLDLREVTVKAHLTAVYRKLGTGNRTQAVKLALDCGFRQQTPTAIH